MTQDLSDDSDFEVDVVEISDSNSDVTGNPLPSKRSSSYSWRNKKVPKGQCIKSKWRCVLVLVKLYYFRIHWHYYFNQRFFN